MTESTKSSSVDYEELTEFLEQKVTRCDELSRKMNEENTKEYYRGKVNAYNDAQEWLRLERSGDR